MASLFEEKAGNEDVAAGPATTDLAIPQEHHPWPFHPSPQGFLNPGVFCYRRVAVMAMFHSPIFLGRLHQIARGHGHTTTDAAEDANCTPCMLRHMAALVWGRWVAPRASRRLPDPARLVLEVSLFGATLATVLLMEPTPPLVALAAGVCAAFVVSIPARGHEPEPAPRSARAGPDSHLQTRGRD